MLLRVASGRLHQLDESDSDESRTTPILLQYDFNCTDFTVTGIH